MLVDSRSLDARAALETDVCIVGAGAAGIALARALAAAGRECVLLESGGFTLDGPTQQLYRGPSVGQPYFPLEATRLRFFGGTTNHWAGYARPLDESDFAVRAWVPHSGWPIGRSDLEPYYERAHDLLELGPRTYDPATWQRRSGLPTLPLEPTRFVSGVFRRSPPTRFGQRYRADVVDSRRVRVLLHSNVTRLDVDADGGRVRAAQVAVLDGPRFEVRARRFVLATGGIENPRLLLASRGPAHPEGIGNAHGLVGRFFLEHPHLNAGTLLPLDPRLDGSFYGPQSIEGDRFVGILTLRDEVLEREGMNRISVSLGERPRVEAAYLEAGTSQGVVSLRHLLRRARRGELPEDLAEHLHHVWTDLDDVARFAWQRAAEPTAPGRMYTVIFRTEQTPNPESRVTLAEERDALGSPRAQLDWRLAEADLHTIVRGHELLAEEAGRSGLGRVYFPPEDPDRTWVRGVYGGNHHMGTTRMHADPRHGVVDADCRVHGTANLYVAGSSVFPTGGFANPTLTLVALALRLADRLARTPA